MGLRSAASESPAAALRLLQLRCRGRSTVLGGLGGAQQRSPGEAASASCQDPLRLRRSRSGRECTCVCASPLLDARPWARVLRHTHCCCCCCWYYCCCCSVAASARAESQPAPGPLLASGIRVLLAPAFTIQPGSE